MRGFSPAEYNENGLARMNHRRFILLNNILGVPETLTKGKENNENHKKQFHFSPALSTSLLLHAYRLNLRLVY
jgi:hypothetical protein